MGAQCGKSSAGELVELVQSPSLVIPDGDLTKLDRVDRGSPFEASAASDTPIMNAGFHQLHYVPDDENTPAPMGIAGAGHEAKPVPRSKSSDFKVTASEVLKARLSDKQLLANPADVILKKVMCCTHKSIVCRAEWQGRTVVAKRVKQDMSEDDPAEVKVRESSTREMMHELQILSVISHPCLVNLLGATISRDQSPMFLTELMEGGDVENYMRKEKETSLDHHFKPRYSLAMRWIQSTAEALSFLHNLPHPIIHRDLKPLNLLLTKDLDVKVTDFGISKIMPEKKSGLHDFEPARMTGGVGTWRYMAPEVVRYQAYTDRIDIYALALIAYFVFSGRQPFDKFCRNDPERILKAYLQGKEIRPELDMFMGSMETRSFLQEAWHADAAKRPSAAQCVERLSEIRQHGIFHSVNILARGFARSVSK
ncbi:unnamed protein product [Effrenium voratum]|nr:unnamed protein product [Effrenium voratum]